MYSLIKICFKENLRNVLLVLFGSLSFKAMPLNNLWMRVLLLLLLLLFSQRLIFKMADGQLDYDHFRFCSKNIWLARKKPLFIIPTQLPRNRFELLLRRSENFNLISRKSLAYIDVNQEKMFFLQILVLKSRTERILIAFELFRRVLNFDASTFLDQ